MKRVLLAITLLSGIVSSLFALTAKVKGEVITSDYRTITIYDDNGEKVLEYRRPYVLLLNKRSLASLYAISWYKEGATTEEIKEWKEFAKLFIEEDK